MKASGGWLAAFSCLLAGSHGRAPADADSLASPTDPCSVANDPRCDAFMADPCGAMNHAKYAEFVKASDGTKASFFRQVDAATKGYISAPRDFYHCGKASHQGAPQCRSRLSPLGAGFINGSSRLGCYGDSVTYEICRRSQLLLSGMPGPDGVQRRRAKKESRFFRQDWIDPPPASHRQSHGFGCSTDAPKRRRDVSRRRSQGNASISHHTTTHSNTQTRTIVNHGRCHPHPSIFHFAPVAGSTVYRWLWSGI